MLTKQEFSSVVCTLVCIAVFQAGFIIPTLYFAYMDENSSCQEGTRGGINLSDWNKIFGFEKAGLNVAMMIAAPVVVYGNELFVYVPATALFLDFFFNIIWWIWGVVVVATNENNNCVEEGKGMAVMAIINLALGGLWFLHLKIAVSIGK